MAQGSSEQDQTNVITIGNLQELEKRFQQAEEELLRKQTELYAPLYKERDPLLDKLPGFWQTVLGEVQDLEELFNIEDSELIESLKNLHVARDAQKPQNFTITMTFEENKYLDATSLSLSKEFERSEEVEGEYKSKAVPIKWKKNISSHKKGERPSFFQFFQWTGAQEDVFDQGEEVALILADEVYPDALKLWTGAQLLDDEPSDDESIDIQSIIDGEPDDDDDDDQEDDDAPRAKKARTG